MASGLIRMMKTNSLHRPWTRSSVKPTAKTVTVLEPGIVRKLAYVCRSYHTATSFEMTILLSLGVLGYGVKNDSGHITFRTRYGLGA